MNTVSALANASSHCMRPTYCLTLVGITFLFAAKQSEGSKKCGTIYSTGNLSLFQSTFNPAQISKPEDASSCSYFILKGNKSIYYRHEQAWQQSWFSHYLPQLQTCSLLEAGTDFHIMGTIQPKLSTLKSPFGFTGRVKHMPTYIETNAICKEHQSIFGKSISEPQV